MRIEREICQLRPEFADFCPTDSAYYAMMSLLYFVTDNQLKSCLNCSKHVFKHSHKAISHSHTAIMIEIHFKFKKNKGPRYSCSAPFVKILSSATRIAAKPNSRSFSTFSQIVGGLENC